mgnify:CR=1 FL=1
MMSYSPVTWIKPTNINKDNTLLIKREKTIWSVLKLKNKMIAFTITTRAVNNSDGHNCLYKLNIPLINTLLYIR